MLDAHPAIGARRLSARSAAEQGTDEAPGLDELNRRYEQRFGFRFVVFVNGRPKRELVPILRGPPRAHAASRSSRRRSTSSSRSPRADGGIPSAGRLLVGLGRPRLPLAARRGRDRLDRLVVLLHRARQPPRAARRRRGCRPGCRRRGLGDPRRRLLPDREVPGRARAASGQAPLVQVGGVHHLALRLRAPRRRLLRARVELPRRSLGRRPDDLGGDRDLGRRARARLARLRRPLPAPRRARPRARRRGRGLRRARRLGRRRAARAAGRLHRGRGDARDDHGRERLLRDHPDALEARPGEGSRRGARPGAGMRWGSSGRSTTTT